MVILSHNTQHIPNQCILMTVYTYGGGRGEGAGLHSSAHSGQKRLNWLTPRKLKVCEQASMSAGNEVLQSLVRVAHGVISLVPRNWKGFYRGPQTMEKRKPERGALKVTGRNNIFFHFLLL